MLFPTHLLVAYLIGRRRELPAYWAVAGAALPDVLDKPMASAGVFELHQTIGHSLTAFVVAAAVVVGSRNGLAGRGGLPGRWSFASGSGVALVVGWASHLGLDALHMVVNGRPADVQFLGWPFVHHVPAVQLPPVEFLFYYLWTPSFFLEVAIWVAVALVRLNEHVVGTR